MTVKHWRRRSARYTRVVGGRSLVVGRRWSASRFESARLYDACPLSTRTATKRRSDQPIVNAPALHENVFHPEDSATYACTQKWVMDCTLIYTIAQYYIA